MAWLVLWGVVLALGWLAVFWWFRRWRHLAPLGTQEAAPTWQRWLPWHWPPEAWVRVLEWGFVGLGAWLSAGVFLNLDPTQIPGGRELPSTIHYYHFWDWIRSCGWCAFWAPFGGGFPILGDPMPGLLHPLVALPVLLWGVTNGIKVAIFLAFLSAGLALWWQGWLWRVRPVVRVWGAWMVMASGMISARLELGDLHTVFSLGALAWMFPAWWYAWQKAGRFAALPFAWALGLGILAARGYHLFGALVTWGALVALMLWIEKAHRRALWTKAWRGLLGAFLLAAPVLLPLARMWPDMVKETDPSFHTTQSLGNLIFNFLIADPEFYRSDLLGKLGYPHLTCFFVGWVPFLLAGYALVVGHLDSAWRERKWPLGWTALWAFLLLWVASGQPLRWLIEYLPWPRFQEFLAGIRHIEQIAALAVVPLLTLSMVGAEDLWQRLSQATLQVHIGARQITVSFTVLLLGLLYLPLRTGWQLEESWMYLTEAPDLSRGLDFLAQAGYQWVDPPFGEHFWVEPAVDRHLKVLTTAILRWRWRDWEMPAPRRMLARGVPEENEADEIVEIEEGLYGLVYQGEEYAFWERPDGTRVPCEAGGWGGQIELRCPEVGGPARLWVMEKAWPGWWAWYDGHWHRLKPEALYLSLASEAPPRTVRLRFLPEASLVGFWVALGWILWQVWTWWHLRAVRDEEGGT